MTVLTFPAVRPSSMTWGLRGNTRTARSPVTGTAQTAAMGGDRWAVTLAFNSHRTSELYALRAFLADLQGEAGRFYLWHHERENPRGSALGTPLVMGAGQTGKTLVTDGWTPSQTGVLLPADMIAVAGQLLMVTASADADGSGVATLAVTPALRAAPADDAPLTVTKALGVFMLASDTEGQVATQNGLDSVVINAVEDPLGGAGV